MPHGIPSPHGIPAPLRAPQGLTGEGGIHYSFRGSELTFRISELVTAELDGEETPMRMDADRGRIRSFSWRNWFAHGA